MYYILWPLSHWKYMFVLSEIQLSSKHMCSYQNRKFKKIVKQLNKF